MKELHRTAVAYYQNASEDIQSMADEFFDSLDDDEDGEVSLPEFLAFMKQEGYIRMANRDFFKELNKNGTGKLDFWEVMTLFYIIHSGRQFCDACGEFMKGLYFACVRCFEHKDTTFSVCPTCFTHGEYVHRHNEFLDNYVLLETKRLENLKKMKERAERESEARYDREGYGTRASSSRAIVQYNTNGRRRDIASHLRLLERVVRVAGGIASLTGGCSIM